MKNTNVTKPQKMFTSGTVEPLCQIYAMVPEWYTSDELIITLMQSSLFGVKTLWEFDILLICEIVATIPAADTITGFSFSTWGSSGFFPWLDKVNQKMQNWFWKFTGLAKWESAFHATSNDLHIVSKRNVCLEEIHFTVGVHIYSCFLWMIDICLRFVGKFF